MIRHDSEVVEIEVALGSAEADYLLESLADEGVVGENVAGVPAGRWHVAQALPPRLPRADGYTSCPFVLASERP